MPKATRPAEAKICILELPVEEVPAQGYLSRHLDINALTLAQQRGLRKLTLGLQREGAKYAAGKSVANNSDAVRYVLERIEAYATTSP